MKSVPTFTATIYVGVKVRETGENVHIRDAIDCCSEYVNDVGLCVSLTTTFYIYTDGMEQGIFVGLINYPRFPSTPEQIREHALTLGEKLRQKMRQHRVSIVFPDETVMLGD